MNRRFLLILVACILAASSRSTVSRGAEAAPQPAYPPVLLDNMDDATPALRLVDQVAGVRLVEQSMLAGRGATDQAAERVLLTVPPGLSAHLAYDLPAAHVLDDFQLSVWVMCNRPGTRLAATVVLPRSIDPETGKPRQMLVRSDLLAGEGGWERITLDDIFVAVARQARVMRVRETGEIDERGAQVTQLVILAPGGTGVTELWVDQIAMYGVLVKPPTAESNKPLFPGPGEAQAATASAVAARTKDHPAQALIAAPRCPRIIQWQGEPFALLKEMGFDGVWLAREPNAGELAEARRLSLALVCPPPADGMAANCIDAAYDPVIAWDLGELASDSELALAQSQAQRLLQCDGNAARPTMLRPRGMTREASGVADLLMVHRPMAGSNVPWPWYAIWLGQQRREARPGTPLWIAIETHHSDGRRAQLTSLRQEPTAVVPLPLAHLSQATTAALTTQPGAIVFQSEASLAAPDEATQMRRLALELTNLRLGLMQPWLAESKSTVAARSNRDDLSALAMKFERSHLIVPLRWGEGMASTAAADPPTPTAFVLPGVPESTDAYLLSSAGYDRLRTRRVTGGLEVCIDALPDDAMVLLTEDAVAFSHVQRYLRDHGEQAARARVELAALRRQQAARALSQLPVEVDQAIGARAALSQVDALLASVVDTMRTRQYAAAFSLAASSERRLDELARCVWTKIDGGLSPAAHPVAQHWSTVVDGMRVADALARGGRSLQWAPCGEFENLDEFVSNWERHAAITGNEGDDPHAAIRLSPDAPHQGAYCLELIAQPAAGDPLPAVASSAQAWVTSPSIAVPPGCLLEITGWVRVPDPLGTIDPLIIFDSIGGEESALRFDAAPSWTPFRLVRAVPPGAACRLTIALGATGRAQVDSLQYRFIDVAPPAQSARSPREVR